MKICAFVGYSGSGKTGLIEKLIAELENRGHAVAVVKNCPQGFSLDQEGKDSWRIMESGARGVGLVSPKVFAVIQKKENRGDFISWAEKYFPDIDIILVEGGSEFRELKKIAVLGREGSKRMEDLRGELVAVVSEREVACEKPVFHPGDIKKIADFLESGFEVRRPTISLEVDGEKVRLNAFVQKIFEKVISGMVESLRGIKANPKRIILLLSRGNRKD